MGQAKNRGTFEDRKAEAVERETLKAAARDAIARKRRAMINTTPKGQRSTIAALIAGVLLASTATTTGARDNEAGY
jgi:hypothetical protein